MPTPVLLYFIFHFSSTAATPIRETNKGRIAEPPRHWDTERDRGKPETKHHPRARATAAARCGGAFLVDLAFLIPRDPSPVTLLDLTSRGSSPLNPYAHSLNLWVFFLFNLHRLILDHWFHFICVASLEMIRNCVSSNWLLVLWMILLSFDRILDYFCHYFGYVWYNSWAFDFYSVWLPIISRKVRESKLTSFWFSILLILKRHQSTQTRSLLLIG